jgi:hypothetical protein
MYGLDKINDTIKLYNRSHPIKYIINHHFVAGFVNIMNSILMMLL